jgi:hypothetical protein
MKIGKWKMENPRNPASSRLSKVLLLANEGLCYYPQRRREMSVELATELR